MNNLFKRLSLIAIVAIVAFASCKNKSSKAIDYLTLNETNFETEIAQGVTLVDFWATWCPPCKAMAPIVDEVASETKGKIKVAKVDVDQNPNLSGKFSIESIPTFIIFKDGQAVETLIGMQNKALLLEKISKHVSLK